MLPIGLKSGALGGLIPEAHISRIILLISQSLMITHRGDWLDRWARPLVTERKKQISPVCDLRAILQVYSSRRNFFLLEWLAVKKQRSWPRERGLQRENMSFLMILLCKHRLQVCSCFDKTLNRDACIKTSLKVLLVFRNSGMWVEWANLKQEPVSGPCLGLSGWTLSLAWLRLRGDQPQHLKKGIN